MLDISQLSANPHCIIVWPGTFYQLEGLTGYDKFAAALAASAVAAAASAAVTAASTVVEL